MYTRNRKTLILVLASALAPMPAFAGAVPLECPHLKDKTSTDLVLRSLACRHWLRAVRAEFHRDQIYKRRLPRWLAVRIERNRLRENAIKAKLPKPAPKTCEPVQPEPVQPKPVQPKPVQPEPVQPEPAKPEPEPKPAKVESVEPVPPPKPATHT